MNINNFIQDSIMILSFSYLFFFESFAFIFLFFSRLKTEEVASDLRKSDTNAELLTLAQTHQHILVRNNIY